MHNVEKYPNFLNNLAVFKQKDFYSMFAHFSTLRMIVQIKLLLVIVGMLITRTSIMKELNIELSKLLKHCVAATDVKRDKNF